MAIDRAFAGPGVTGEEVCHMVNNAILWVFVDIADLKPLEVAWDVRLSISPNE